MSEAVYGYRPERRLGEGAFGTVWLARHPVLGRTVAVKFIHPWLREQNPGYLVRFREEARLLGRLGRHPRLVEIENFDLETGRFLVLEYVDGESLRALLAREGRLGLDRALAIARQMAEGLAHAHGRGVVHRDVKPENVLVARDGSVKVADFGVARAIGSERLAELRSLSFASSAGGPQTIGGLPTGEAPGSPGAARSMRVPSAGTFAYMSPEAQAGQEADAPADVYACGLVLYEMLVGKRPGLNRVRLAGGLGALGAGIDRLLERCWQDDPARRPADGAALVAELEAGLVAASRAVAGAGPGAGAGGAGRAGAPPGPGSGPARPASGPRPSAPPRAGGTSARRLWAALAVLATAAGVIGYLTATNQGPRPSEPPGGEEPGAVAAQAVPAATPTPAASPAPALVPAPELDLSDLARWDRYEKAMVEAYRQVEALDASDMAPAARATAWNRFRTTYAENDPNSTEDDAMRAWAAEREARLRAWTPTSTPRPTTFPTAVPSPEATPAPTAPARRCPAGMAWIPGGTFRMGSPPGEGDSDEHPLHAVTLDAFCLDVTEVTNRQFEAFVEATGYVTTAERGGTGFGESEPGKGDWDWQRGLSWRKPRVDAWARELLDHPVVQVSWEDASRFCAWAGKRLPSEAEWERACRGPEGSRYAWGDEMPPSGRVANVADESARRVCKKWSIVPGYDDSHVYTAPVASFPASGYGLRDMTGNVWEWVSDWYEEDYYGRSPERNPAGPPGGKLRVLRGGSWIGEPSDLRCGDRVRDDPTDRNDGLGARCARTPD